MKTQHKFIIISFFVLVIALGSYFLRSKQVSKTITDEIALKETEAEKFPVNIEVKEPVQKKGYWDTKYTDKPVWREKDPFEKTPEESAWDKKTDEFLKKEFFIIPENTTSAAYSKMLQSKIYWMENYILNNEVWYKSEFQDVLSDSKNTMFFNFYNCSMTNPKTRKPVRCVKIFLYSFDGDDWSTASMAGREDNIRWKNNTAYMMLFLDYMGDYTKRTNAWMLMIPMPRDSMPFYYIRRDGNKVVQDRGPDSDWVLTTEKEFMKFATWAMNYKVKHGEMPDP